MEIHMESVTTLKDTTLKGGVGRDQQSPKITTVKKIAKEHFAKIEETNQATNNTVSKSP